jgi:HAD superfamily hydrolase (TIGR01458 family)
MAEHRLRALCLDLDGVVYQGERALPGAIEAIAEFRRAEVPMLFVTNTSSRPRSALCAKLAGMGLEVAEDELFTPAVAACQRLRDELDGPLALFVPPALRGEFAEFEPLPVDAESGAGAVLVGDLGAGWDFATLNRAFRLLMASRKCPLYALGGTRYWAAEGGLRMDTGAFVSALEYAATRRAWVCGKPSRRFFRAAAARLGHPLSEVLMVGDDVIGDVRGAQKAGLSAVLVQTGKYRASDLAAGVKPSALLPSIAALPDWWARRG